MLIIVESPAKAKTISKIVGNKHIVKASVGHIRGISDLKKTKEGKTLEINGIDIEDNFTPLYEIDEAKKQVVSDLKKLAKSSKDGILFATDSDREGEAISWHLAQVLGVKDLGNVQRLEFHEITKSAIDKAMSNPRPLNLELVHAQQARQVLDKLVGYKLSPVLWTTIGNYKLSAGRVQSPALHILCQREHEINSFISQEYWEISGIFSHSQNTKAKVSILKTDIESEEKSDKYKEALKLTKLAGNKISDLSSQEQVNKILDGLENHTKFEATNIAEKIEKSSPKPPFTTSTLQQAASSKLGFTPKITMQLAQKLYEGIDLDGEPTALITYMRTDSFNLSSESIAAARKYIQAKHPKNLPQSPKIYKSKSKNAQEAHEAIRPVNPLLHPDQIQGKLEPRLLKLYELIWRQMIASQMTEEIRKRVSFDIINNRQDQFSGSISWTIDAGYKLVTLEKIDTLEKSSFSEGEILYLQELIELQKFTKPPSRYSPASLIKKLEEAGIGRPSTYATIISTLHDRGYVESSQNSMIPTTLGMSIDLLLHENFQDITGSEMTAKMEESLDDISRGEKEYTQVLHDFWYPFKELVETKSKTLKVDKNKYTSSATDVQCPTCQGEMVLKLGRFGEYYQCQQDAKHQFPKNFREYNKTLDQARLEYADQTEGKVCEICKKDLIVRVSKSSLKPYIACPDYQVGNKHTVTAINFGLCPQCQAQGRAGKESGVLVQKKGFRGKSFIGCSLDKKICDYVQPVQKL